MRKILLLIIAITMLCSCDKDDKENNEIPIPQPFPQEEQNRLIKELAGYWENCGEKISDYDHVYTKEFTKYDHATKYTAQDTFVLPRLSRLNEFQLSPGLEIDGHQTIWIDETQSKSQGPTKFYYIKNDSLHIYRNYGIYTWGKRKFDIAEHMVFKHRKDVQFIKEEDINKELIGKWVNQQGFGTFEYFKDFTYVYTSGYGWTFTSNYEISYGAEEYHMYCDDKRDMYYSRKTHTLLYDNKKYVKME